MADYFLHVELLVEQANARIFEQTVNNPELLALFAPFQWRLLYGLKGRGVRDIERPHRGSRVRGTGDESTRNCFRYVNVWDVPDPPGIAEVMQRLADSNLYEVVNSIVAREIQNQVLSTRIPKKVEATGGTFVEVHRRFTVNNLGKYVYMSGIPVPVLESNGWINCGFYQALTGPLNSVTEIWYNEKESLPSSGSFYKMVMNAGGLGQSTGMSGILNELDKLPREEWYDLMDSYLNK